MGKRQRRKIKRLLRRPIVEDRTGHCRSSIYALMASGDFPKPVRIGEKSVAWVEDEIDAWVEARIAARDVAGDGAGREAA